MTIWQALTYLFCAIATLVCLWVGLGGCLIAYLSTHPVRRFDEAQTPSDFGASYETVTFPSRTGDVQLCGWMVHPAKTVEPARGVVIVCHGMQADRREGMPWARVMWKRGYHVLMFDFRAAGQSEGDLCSAGYLEAEDLIGAVDYVTDRADCANLPVGVFGFSMGGATAISAASRDTRISAVVTHGAYASLDRAILYRCRKHFHAFAPLAALVVHALGRVWLRAHPSAVSPVKEASSLAPRALYILHGAEDRVVLSADAEALHRAVGASSRLRIIENAGHRRIPESVLQGILDDVGQFFETHLSLAHSNAN